MEPRRHKEKERIEEVEERELTKRVCKVVEYTRTHIKICSKLTNLMK